jgi:hypothetical protein
MLTNNGRNSCRIRATISIESPGKSKPDVATLCVSPRKRVCLARHRHLSHRPRRRPRSRSLNVVGNRRVSCVQRSRERGRRRLGGSTLYRANTYTKAFGPRVPITCSRAKHEQSLRICGRYSRRVTLSLPADRNKTLFSFLAH